MQPSDKIIWIGEYPAPAGLIPDNDTSHFIPKVVLVSGNLSISEALFRLEALRSSEVPWLVMADAKDSAAWLKAGAAGFIPPGTPIGLIHAALSRIGDIVDSAQARNSLTGLPGNDEIKKELKKEVLGGNGFAAYFDITGFKPFNDYYGFTLGDAVLRGLSEILSETLHGFFIGNIGGDDFVSVCSWMESDKFKEVVHEAVSKFNRRAPGYYSSGDVQRGGIEALDRFGKMKFFPFMTLTASIVSNENCKTIDELARKAGLEKKRLRGEIQRRTVSIVLCHDGRIPALDDFKSWYSSGYSVDDAKALLESAGIVNDRKMKNCLCEILLSNEAGDIRKSAARALGRLADVSTGDILLEALEDKNPHIRTLVSESLPYVLGSKAGPHLARLLEDSNTWVRRAALRGIGMSGWSGAKEILRAVLRSDRNESVWTRDYAKEKIAALDGAALLADTDLLDDVLHLLHSNQGIPKAPIWNALLTLGDDNVVREAVISIRNGSLGHMAKSLERLELRRISDDIVVEFKVALAEVLKQGNPHNQDILSFYSKATGCPIPPAVLDKLIELLEVFSGREQEELLKVLEIRKIEIPREKIIELLNCRTGRALSRDGALILLRCIAVSRNHTMNAGVLLNKFLRKKEISREEAIATARCIISLF